MMIGILLALQLMGPVLGNNTNASLALATQPAGGTFTLYNLKGEVVQQGKTPFVGMIPAGRYRLIIQKVGYYPEQRSVSIIAGQQKIIQVELFPQAKRPAPPAGQQAPAQTRQAPTTRPAPQSPPAHRTQPPTTGPPPPPAANEIPPGPRGTPAPTQGKAPQQPDKRKASKLVKKKEKPKAVRKIPWIPLAAAAGLAVAGGIFWGLSDGALGASNETSRTQIEAYNEYQQARSHRSTAVFLFAGSGVALGLAALFYFWPPSSDKKEKTRSRNDDIPIIGFTINAQE